MARRTGNHGKSSASEFDETEGFSFHVPDLRERQYYRERSVDIPERGPVCTNNTPQNERNYSDEMQRRFEKARKDEEKLLSSTSRNDVFDDDDDDVLAMKPLTVLIGGDSKKAKKDEENEDDRFEMNGDFLKQIQKKRRRHRRRRSGSFTGGVWPRKGHRNRSLLGYAIPPPNVHSTDWRDMLAITDSKDAKLAARLGAVSSIRKATETAEGASTSGGGAPAAANVISPAMTSSSGQFAGSSASVPALFSQYRFSTSNMSLNRANWILETFTRRECARFIPTHRDERKCGCGRLNAAHLDLPELTSQYLNQKKSLAMIERSRSVAESEADKENIKAISDCVERRQNKGPNHHHRWSMRKHTVCVPTDAFGQIEFQGGPHPYKAQYVRMNFDTEPAYIMSLFEHVWQIAPPRLIITVHGGTGDFDLQPKLARVFRKGLLKAATTTGAWIITSGCNTGVVRHVAAALEVAGSAQRNKIVCIGIAPWGMLKKREELKGEDVTVPYYPVSAKGRFTGLNNRHSYFLLVDNGTVGRYGAEVILRKRLETYISQKQKIFGSTRSVPVVCVVLEGGSCTIRSVLDYVTNVPRVPVVVCDGSGRAADLLAFAHQTVEEDGSLPEGVRPQLHTLVERVFGCTGSSADRVLHELIICAQQKNLLTIFRLGEKGEHDVDHAILTALLKGQNLSPADQLALALAWNRVDIARSDIFAMGHEWPQAALHNAMMEALIHDRVDFVRLLLENGVNMQRFLSISRLEELYNTDKGPPNTLYYIVRDVVKVKSGYRYRLPHIGMVIEKLMGNAYRSLYTSNEFREKYQTIMKKFKAQHKQMRMMNQNRMATGSVPMSRQSTEPAFFGNFGNQDTISEPVGISVSALSGSRALSNHILWRSAFRRDYPINQSSMRPPNLNDSRDANSEVEDERSTMDGSEISHNEYQFRYPYSELLLWAVLTKRQEMALCMWQHGEEALAKALVACRLYKSLATEAAEDYLEVEICDELKKYAEEFRVLSLELLDHCYHHDDAQTLQLLTYELSNWSDETCLALAVMVNNKNFLAHPCCQILLADLWHGGLRIRSHSNVKVVGGLVMPLSILMLEFKTREELLNQPQTAAEHEQDLNDSSSSSGNSSSSSEDSSSSSFEDDYDDELTPGETVKDRRSRKQSHGSVSSLNLPPTHIGSLFASSRHRKKRKTDRDTDASANEAGRIGANGGNEYGTFRVNSVSPDRPIQLRHRTRHSSYLAGKSDDTKVSSVYGSNSVIANAKSPVTSLINSKAFPINSILPGFQRTRPIKVRRRFYEFYAAPITTFWAWALSFVCFIIGLTFVLLVRTPPKPSWLEWTLFAYVVSFGMEHMRKMFMSDMKPFVEKLKFFFFNWWNSVTMVAVLLFIIGFVIRVFGYIFIIHCFGF
ncbi:unnamed protein product [Caenorhabditis auriculariae]|uniref:TRPM SLOG domain-containing protein n=1 Tax=Caenorhabditis auriculariae TaxID=2777116 RepID=A0A8S1GQQ0_9PELO|nr:unnamed protein product [Caenorhabditis auriculariae]